MTLAAWPVRWPLTAGQNRALQLFFIFLLKGLAVGVWI